MRWRRRTVRRYLLATGIMAVVLGAAAATYFLSASPGISTTSSTRSTTKTTVSTSSTSTGTDSGNDYLSNREAVAQWLENNYNSTYQLIRGGLVGSCGYQPYAFDIIDGNLLAGHALGAYNATMADSILAKVTHYLSLVGYQNDDRREVLFGNSIPFPPLQGGLVTIAGLPPTGDCLTPTKFWIVSELPSEPWTNYSQSMNAIVPALLQLYKQGDVSSAQALFYKALGWWDGKGFMSQGAIANGNFNTRSICYFLFAQKATRFPVDQSVLDQMQSQLWSLQLPKLGGGLATGYSFNGSALSRGDGGHTSNEINGICLLAYDPRIQTTWWPSSQSTAAQQLSNSGFLWSSVAEVVDPTTWGYADD